MNLEDDETTNRSDNRPFADVLAARVSRRTAIAGGLATMATTFVAPSVVSAQATNGNQATAPGSGGRSRVNFEPVAIADGGGPNPAISPDYQYDVILPWGEPILPPYPEHVNGQKSAADQEKQIGIGHDGMHFFPVGPGNGRGTLALNHEFGRNTHVFGKDDPESLEDVRLSQAAHGISMVEIRKSSRGTWSVVRGHRRNRRVTVNTPVTFSGPAAGHPALGDPTRPSYGTVNNCSSGATPWGTYVTCEENFNGYFGATGGWTPTESQSRYGFSETGFGYGWETFDPRFDLSSPDHTGEDNRFGWCVEIDPNKPRTAPVKRTAMGRFKHEGAAFTTGLGGKVVCYMGDDQRFDYIYKYVSRKSWRAMRAEGVSPLDDGDLYVARFDDDGTGVWLHLDIADPVLANLFADQGELLIDTRLAADALGATPMDRPEWATVAPNGDVYCTLTNNSRRIEPNAANPLAPNADGHIIRWTDTRRNTGLEFEWDIYLFAQDTHGTDDTFSDPDGLWADKHGRLFIETDGGQKDGLNNQIMVADLRTGDLRRLLTGVAGDEITGIAYTPNQRIMFANSQHPGNGDPNLTNFPVMNETPDGATIPRDATFVITKKDGGIVGS